MTTSIETLNETIVNYLTFAGFILLIIIIKLFIYFYAGISATELITIIAELMLLLISLILFLRIKVKKLYAIR